MRSSSYLCVLGLVAMAAVGCGHSAVGGKMSQDIYPLDPKVLDANGMEVVWHTNATLATDPVLKRLWLTNQYLVACDRENRIYTVDARTGVRMFSARVAESYQTVWQPAAYKDILYVPTTTTLWSFQGVDGRDAGHKKTDFAPSGGAATNGYMVFVPDARGWLQAVAVSKTYVDWNFWAGGGVTGEAVANDGVEEALKDKGESTWNFNVKGKDVKGWRGLDWGRWTEEPITSQPVIDGQRVYFAGQDGVVYASQQGMRHVDWEHKAEGPFKADLTRTKNDLVLAPCLDYTLYALSSGGRVAWAYNSGERLDRKAFSTGNQVFVFTPDAGMTALDTAAGRKQWAVAEGAEFVSSSPDTAYILSRKHELMAINRADGKVKWSIPVPHGVLFAPNETDNGLIYMTTRVGNLVAIGKKAPMPERPAPGTRPTPGPEVNTLPAPIAAPPKPVAAPVKPVAPVAPVAPAPAAGGV
jgi:hypothetical protein